MATRSQLFAPVHARRRSRRSTFVAALVTFQIAALSLAWAVFGSPVNAACGSFQSLVTAASAGSTITVPSCTYHEEVWVRKPLTINASGVVIDGDGIRGVGIAIVADDVTVNGLTVTNVKSPEHGGAVWTTGVSRFTFRNGRARDSSTICVSLNGGSGHQVLDSEMTGCGKEGFFTHDVTDSLFARNHIHHNNAGLTSNADIEAGGGKALKSRRVTFEANEVDHNGGPGIWFDGGSTDAVVRSNRVHHNNRAGVFFEISSGATIANNAVWNNGFGFVAWGYGAGITISSSDRAQVHDNTVAWNARGISVISQARELVPHDGNVVHDNVIVSQAGSFVAGWYDDHGGSLFADANGNQGYGNRYWVGAPEPSSDRFLWTSAKATLADFNSTPGEQGATYLTAADRDAALAAAGVPAADGSILPGTPTVSPTPGPLPPPPGGSAPTAPPPTPGSPSSPIVASTRLEFGTGRMRPDAALPGRASWSAASGATLYQAQVQRNGGAWQPLVLATPTARAANLTLEGSNRYRVRARAQSASGVWGSWTYSTIASPVRLQETNPSVAFRGRWDRVQHTGSSGAYARRSSTAQSTAALRFSGVAVSWIAPRGPAYGLARIYIDGRLRATVNLNRSEQLMRTIAFRASWASRGTHTIVVQVLGTSGHPRVELDAFAILR